tara:strand:+ start:1764 stop:1904 length:141 start_codon:yes stop_codon:yes gene_type:complete
MTWLYVILGLFVVLAMLPLLSLLVVGIIYGPIIDTSHCRPDGGDHP